MNSLRSKKKKLTDNVYAIIRNDIPLRHKLATALQIEPQSVYVAATRKSIKFSIPFVLEIIAKHTGKTKDELLNND